MKESKFPHVPPWPALSSPPSEVGSDITYKKHRRRKKKLEQDPDASKAEITRLAEEFKAFSEAGKSEEAARVMGQIEALLLKEKAGG